MNTQTKTAWLPSEATIFSLVLAMYAGRAIAEVPAADGGPPVPVIDMHTHVFNARDLPLAGLLSALGVPAGVAQSLAIILNNWTAEDHFDDPPPFGAVHDQTMRTLAASVQAKSDRTLRSLLTEPQRKELLDYAGIPEVEVKGMELLDAEKQKEAELEIVARALRKANFPPSENHPDTTTLSLLSVGLDGYARFVDIITDSNQRIAKRLCDEEYPQVDLFVHHMMDMEKAYADEPAIRFDSQMQRMSQLNRRFAGKLLHFVAFDPFRRDDSLESARRGLEAGAVGVKFYPPTGYRPTGNTFPRKPGIFRQAARHRWNARYKHLTEEKLDELNDALFRHCIQYDIPIFTHCTPGGFEADKDYGWMADPAYWSKVLSKHPTLRLCFGHSGGDDYWFARHNRKEVKQEHQRRSFGTNVVKLCLTYPNVYCEVGYLERILDVESVAVFTNRLASVIDQRAEGNDWAFGDKIMYGTDWHMIHKEDNHKQYLSAFKDIFSAPAFQEWQRAFFARNAVRFLKLGSLAQDERFSEAQRQYWRSLLTRVELHQSTSQAAQDPL